MNGVYKVVILLAKAVLLVGCVGGDLGAFSAEDAAVRFGTEQMSEGVVVDPQSIEVRQVREVDDNKFVLFSFTRMMNNHQERCLMLYETHRTIMQTWASGSGGGGCGGSIDGTEEALPLIEAGGGMGTSSDDPLGHSHSYGLINDDRIVKVRVTWDDGNIFETDVINSSYLIMRSGQIEVGQVEGLDADGAVVEKVEWGRPAPGKE